MVGRICCLLLCACVTPQEIRLPVQSDSKQQLLMSDASQARLRATQSRVFDTTDRRRILAATIALMQDLGLIIEVLDEELGVVSGKCFLPSRPFAADGQELPASAPSYHLYSGQSLLIFSRNFRDWGPFQHREDLVRVTVTVRQRNKQQTVVRASVQFFMASLTEPEPYQRFFDALAESLAVEAQLYDEVE